MVDEYGAIIPDEYGAVRVDDDGAVISTRAVDDFERADLAPYRNTGGFNISSSRASQGQYSVYGSGNTSMISTPGDGLPYYPVRGDTIKFDIYFPGSSNRQVTFGYATQDIDAGYEVQFRFDRDEIYWVESDPTRDEYNAFDRASHNFQTGVWKTCTIDWGQDGQTLEFDGETLHTGTIRGDSNRDSGGIYYRVVNRSAFFDNVRSI